jgi:hypothetical protein
MDANVMLVLVVMLLAVILSELVLALLTLAAALVGYAYFAIRRRRRLRLVDKRRINDTTTRRVYEAKTEVGAREAFDLLLPGQDPIDFCIRIDGIHDKIEENRRLTCGETMKILPNKIGEATEEVWVKCLSS